MLACLHPSDVQQTNAHANPYNGVQGVRIETENGFRTSHQTAYAHVTTGGAEDTNLYVEGGNANIEACAAASGKLHTPTLLAILPS